MANAEQTFRAKAPGIMAQLVRDFPITPEDAAAIVGNLGHESQGFTAMQEFKPVVAGSRGGWGWAQWTGPRRRAFEAYCARTGKTLPAMKPTTPTCSSSLRASREQKERPSASLRPPRGLMPFREGVPARWREALQQPQAVGLHRYG